MKRGLLGFLLVVFAGNAGLAQSEITARELGRHIGFLAADQRQGRFPGTKGSRQTVRYIEKQFKRSGIRPLQTGYFQPFAATLRVRQGQPVPAPVPTGNVVGLLRGSDPILQNEYIVLGAHYDHLGLGGPSSKAADTTAAIHNGADDNASGVAALLEIGQKLAAHRSELRRSVILVAFGAEEQGLLGSKYFTEHPPVPLDSVRIMLNMDMLGRLNAEQQVYMGGAASFPGGEALMKALGPPLGLTPIVNAYSVGGSDHVSFFRKNIPVLGLHTGGHPEYHTPADDAALINLPGEARVAEYIYRAVLELSRRPEPLTFVPEPKGR